MRPQVLQLLLEVRQVGEVKPTARFSVFSAVKTNTKMEAVTLKQWEPCAGYCRYSTNMLYLRRPYELMQTFGMLQQVALYTSGGGIIIRSLRGRWYDPREANKVRVT